jgi:CheY-like chemotaxis protein
MPILDGYRATHLLRHHSPYTDIDGLRAIPIIAMTASAIQGDKEKCKEAGMNDYLAKPVKAKTLESMLIKWARRRRAKRNESLDLGPTEPEAICTDPEASSHEPHIPPDPIIPSREHETSHGISGHDASPWTQCEGDRDMQRCRAEEKATALRDDKLLAASAAYSSYTGKHVSPSFGPSMRPGSPTPALTEENMGILDREHDESPTTNARLPNMTRGPSMDRSSMPFGSRESSPPSSTVGSLQGQGPMHQGKSWDNAMRVRLHRNDSDRSQATVVDSRSEE